MFVQKSIAVLQYWRIWRGLALPAIPDKGPNIAGYDPETECLQPLFNPRIHDWDDHFYWDGPMLVGMTPIGRTTIDVLRINAEERVWLREQLMENGEYPI